MRIALLPYPGIRRECYEQLISAALRLAKGQRMQEVARWSWSRFSTWLHGHPFEMDNGSATADCATACNPPQRMREFPETMNCWERVLHQLAWFAARGAERVTVYDHRTLVGRHIEVLVPPTTYLGTAETLPVRPIANDARDQAISGVFGGLQGGVAGAGMGAAAGPYGALAGFILGAAMGAAKGAMNAEQPPPTAAAPSPPGIAETAAARAPPSPPPQTEAPLSQRLPQIIAKPKPSPAPHKRSARVHRNRNRTKE